LKSTYKCITDYQDQKQVEVSFKGRNNESEWEGLCIPESKWRRGMVTFLQGTKRTLESHLFRRHRHKLTPILTISSFQPTLYLFT
jgi:hypothetical protein